jgi:hypothetical protein
LIINYRDNTPPSTPEHVRAAAQQNERDQRVLDSPEHRTSHHVCMTRLGPPIPDTVIPPVIPPAIPQFSNLPANLAQQLADLPPLNPVRQRGRGRGRGRGRQAPIVPEPEPAAFGLAPAFELAPAPAASTTNYPHLPGPLGQQLAQLPPLLPPRGRVRRNIPAPAPPPFEEIMARYAALPPVCYF